MDLSDDQIFFSFVKFILTSRNFDKETVEEENLQSHAMSLEGEQLLRGSFWLR